MSRYLRLAAISFVAILAFGISAAAQQQSSTDNSTPTGQAKGTPPLGSFGGSDFDKVNLFNGNVSMQFPLSMSGGRAGMGAGATLSYNSKFWRMVTDRPNPQNSYNVPTYDEWDNGTFIAPGWRINTGRLVARHSGWNPSSGNCGSEPAGNQETLTRITFIAPDGTEYEFRDTLDDANPANDGQPSLLGPANCGTLQAYNRKSVWITYDGSAATFVSSADIWDISLIPGGGDPPFQTYPSGDVYLRDGTSFRVTNGRVDWMQDRNGNRVSYTYYSGSPNGGFLHTITDTLGRVTEFSYNIVDPDDVTGQTNLLVRVVQHRDPSDPDDDQVWKVVRLKLKNALRQDYVTDADPTYEELWPGTLTGPFNENMPSAVVLPTGHSWKFLYNRYGEVASVETPAHGKIEFDVVAGAGNTPTGPSPFVFRYLKERRTYVRAVDASPEGKTSYDDPSVGYPAVGTPPAETVVDVIRYIGTTSIINRSRHFFYSHPLTGVRSPRSDGYTRWQEGLEFKTEEAGSVGSTWVNRSRSHATWRQASPVGWIPSATTETENQPASNPRVIDKTTTILENGLDLVSKVDYVFDTTPYNNVTQERVFDWGAGAPSSTVLRQVNRTFEKSATYTSATIANVVHSRSLVLTESVGTGGAAESMTTNVYDGESIETCIGLSTATHNPAFNSSRVIRGNMTSVTLDPKDGSPLSTTRMRYDEAGNAIRVISANSLAPGAVEAAFTTQIDFYDPLDPLHAFPRATTRTVSKASGGPATVLSTSAIFNRWSGLITSATGYNPGETTTYSYDNFDRIQSITPPAGVGVTMVVYSAPAADLSVQSTSETIGTGSSNSSTTIVTYDGLFRAVKQQATDPNGTGLVTVDTKYDGLGRPTLVSNPYRTTGAAPTHGWTRTRYDDQNRVVLVSFFDNGPLSPPGDFETSDTGDIATVHNAGGFTVPTVTVTEQAGKQRRSGSDALGRMLWVREDPNGLNYLTTYGYDGRGNLLSVNQGGQSRTFVYDGLGRLKSAKMPECVNSSGVQVATTYTYDRESNLVTKTDPRNVTTWFSYDEMNRLRTKNFSNTAVNDVSYFYDDSGHGPAIEIPDSSGLMPGSPFDRGFSLGRLVGVVTNATASNETEQVRTGVFYGYDVAGRVTHYDQLLESTHYQNPSVPTYNRASEIVNQSYPSGSTVTNTYNVAGSLTSVAANLGGASAGSTNATYTPSGSLEEQRLSTTTALFHKIGYNSRLQPVQISLGVSSGASDKLGLSYQYGNLNTVDPGSQPDQTRNNGNPARITVSPDSGQTSYEQYFLYDELNRLERATEYFGSGGGGGSCTGAPAAPSGIAASANGPNQITVTWTDNESGVNNETLFRIQRSTDGGATWPTEATVGQGVTQYVDNSVAVGPSYLYRVRAENTCDPSNWNQMSEPVSTTNECTDAPPAASGVQGTAVGLPILVFWNDNASGANNETSVRVERTLHAGQPVWTDASGELIPDTHEFTDTNTAPLTTYRYRVVSTNLCGSSIGSESIGITSGSSTGCTAAPAAPSALTAAAAAGSSTVNLSWVDNGSGINDEWAWTIERSADEGATWKVTSASATADVPSFADTSAHAQTTYVYRVRATNECGASAYSQTARATTFGGPNDFAVEFNVNASGEYASSPGHSQLTPAAAGMTIEAWIRPAYLGAAAAQPVVSKRAPNLHGYELSITKATDPLGADRLTFTMYGTGGAVLDTITSNIPVVVGSWVHVSAGYSSNKLFVTVGGTYKEKNSTTSRPTQNNSVSTEIARGGPGSTHGLYFKGRVDRVRLSNLARYTATFPPSLAYGNDGNTRAMWSFDENIGTTANDPTNGTSNTFNNVMTLSSTLVPSWVLGASATGAAGTDTIGIVVEPTATWFLRNSISSGAADLTFGFGGAGSGFVPLAGDWDGDGDDTPGLYDPLTGSYFLRNDNSSGAADLAFGFGPGGLGWQPVTGDWNGDGTETIGLYDPASGFFFLRNANAPGAADLTFSYGPGGLGWKPIVGDWNGDGSDTIGAYDPLTSSFFLRNANSSGNADVVFGFGPAASGWTPLAGDWDANGIDTVGLYAPGTGTFYLRDVNENGVADYAIGYGPANVTPLVGDWDGIGFGPKAAPEATSTEHPAEAPAVVEIEAADENRVDEGAGADARRRADKLDAAPSWDQQFDYDQWGNRTTLSPAISTATNRITATNYVYDDMGNLTRQPAGASYTTLDYDGNNRIHRVRDSAGSTIAKYTYDGEGKRVRKEVPGASPSVTRYVYGMGGALVAEYTASTTTPSKEYLYGASGLLAIAESGTVRYVTPDHLGTPRVLTTSAGAVSSRHDYMPYGEELFAGIGGRTTGQNYTPNDGVSLRQKYTGYERDAESGLDYAQARYFDKGTGRFSSTDSFGGSLGNPQTLNLYAYVQNSPLVYVDPTGHWPQFPTGVGIPTDYFRFVDAAGDLSNTGGKPIIDESVDVVAKKPGFFRRLGGWIKGVFKAAGKAGPGVDFAVEMLWPETVGGGEDTRRPTKVDLWSYGNAQGPIPTEKDYDLIGDGPMILSQYPHGTKGKSAWRNDVGMRGTIWMLPAGSMLPGGLEVVADGADVGGPHPAGHHTIYPVQNMPVDDFKSLFNKEWGWKKMGKR